MIDSRRLIDRASAASTGALAQLLLMVRSMRHLHRPGGRAPAAVLSLSLCLASACVEPPGSQPDAGLTPDAMVVPTDAAVIPPDADVPPDAPPGETESLPPLAYTMVPTYATPPFIIPRPAAIHGHLYLEVDAAGTVSGVISARDSDTVSLATVNGRREGSEIVIEDGAVAVTPGGSLGLDELRITLRDNDGDGAIDGADGQAAGSWQRALGDIFDQTTYTSVVAAGLDTTATTASLSVARPSGALLPFDAMDVRFQEPLREADVREHLRVLADGTTITGELTLTATGGLVTAARLQPDTFLGFGAQVTLDLAGLHDPAGNALAASGAQLSVVADPGPLADNTGFESGLAGWIAVGQADTRGAFQGFAPVAGAAQAVVREGGTLAAALDVAGDATELELSVAVLSEIGVVDANRTTVIALRQPGGASVEIFDVADVADQFQPCATCTDYGRSVGPLRRAIDLAPYRGQRVFLTVDVRSSFFIGVNFFAALVDDIQLR
jgi:hypothetical protein